MGLRKQVVQVAPPVQAVQWAPLTLLTPEVILAPLSSLLLQIENALLHQMQLLHLQAHRRSPGIKVTAPLGAKIMVVRPSAQVRQTGRKPDPEGQASALSLLRVQLSASKPLLWLQPMRVSAHALQSLSVA